MVSGKFSPQILATNLTNVDSGTFCSAHNENIPHLFRRCNNVQHFLLTFETFLNKKCVHVTNMKLKEDFVLFGNAKDFESDEIFDFIISFTKFFKCK